MNSPLLKLVLAVAVAAGAAAGCTQHRTATIPAHAAAQPTGLPDLPGTVDGWTAVGAVQHYAADDLYLYINGGAVNWIECGFRQVAAREYAHRDENRLMLEIYEMVSESAAACIYDRRDGSGGETLGLGDEGRCYEYYLEFRSGRHLATITSLTASASRAPELVEFARQAALLLDSDQS